VPRLASSGTCLLCGASVTKRGVPKHLEICAPAHDLGSADQELVGRFRIAGLGSPVYWLDVEARLSATLSSLDNWLRRTWLECCGHLSMFEIGRVRFLPVGAGTLDPFGRRDSERSMSARIGDAFPHLGTKGTYDYDFGSTTTLSIVLTHSREARLGRSAVRLLTRNNPPVWPCGICGEPASLICAVHERESSPFVCALHERKHTCRDRAFLPVVNSPRMGVCGYAG
jgi:hypothetical protein